MIGQAVADGFLTGAILALGAIGVSLGSQILKFANFSHSELLTWGAYLALTFTAFATAGAPVGPLSFGWPLLVAVIIAGLLTGVLALIVDRLVFRRLRSKNANSLTMVFASFGIALVLRNLVLLLWGPEAQYYTSELQIAIEVLPDIRLLPDQVFVLGLTIVVVITLHAMLKYSRLGMSMRAMAESPSLSRVCGVKIETRRALDLGVQRHARGDGGNLHGANRAAATGDGIQHPSCHFHGGYPGWLGKPVRCGARRNRRRVGREPVSFGHSRKLQGCCSIHDLNSRPIFPPAGLPWR